MPKNANPETVNPVKTSSEATKPTITEKLTQLDQAVEWFYSDDFSLDQALDKYQAAINLAKEAERDLAEMKNKVEVLEDFTKS